VRMLVRAIAAEQEPREHDHGENSGADYHVPTLARPPVLLNGPLCPKEQLSARRPRRGPVSRIVGFGASPPIKRALSPLDTAGRIDGQSKRASRSRKSLKR
jgi:hypothetical protein